jgi:hypothetical protein
MNDDNCCDPLSLGNSVSAKWLITMADRNSRPKQTHVNFGGFYTWGRVCTTQTRPSAATTPSTSCAMPPHAASTAAAAAAMRPRVSCAMASAFRVCMVVRVLQVVARRGVKLIKMMLWQRQQSHGGPHRRCDMPAHAAAFWQRQAWSLSMLPAWAPWLLERTGKSSSGLPDEHNAPAERRRLSAAGPP